MKIALNLLALLSLAACGSGDRAARSVSVCDLAQQPQRLVAVDAIINDSSDSRTLISDDTCAGLNIELQLTNAALRAGVRDQLVEAFGKAKSASPPQRVSARLTGMFAAAAAGSGAYFSAEKVENVTLR
jgi:hypothetical protein